MSSSGLISAHAGLAAGTYVAKGTDKDTDGDAGTWTFTLIVKGSRLIQLAPTSGRTKTGQAFITQLKVSGVHGKVTFFQSFSTGTQIVVVLYSGKLLAPEIYTPGSYKVSGTMKDSLGDTGTWSYTLIVAA